VKYKVTLSANDFDTDLHTVEHDVMNAHNSDYNHYALIF
jgi:hypothetical protein